MSLRHPSGHFTLHKVFSPVTPLGFRVWGTSGFRDWVGGSDGSGSKKILTRVGSGQFFVAWVGSAIYGLG